MRVVIRLLTIAAFVVLGATLFSAYQNNAFAGPSHHYTFVLKSGTDAKTFANNIESDTVKVENVISDGEMRAVTANVASDDVSQLQNHKSVNYIVYDHARVEKHTFWDSVEIATGVNLPTP